MTNNQTSPQSSGKGFRITAFVISLVLIAGWIFAHFMAVALAVSLRLGEAETLTIIWAGSSLITLVLAILGMIKAKKNGAKKGLALTALIISVVVTGLSVLTWVKAHEAFNRSLDLSAELYLLKEQFEPMTDTTAAY